MGKFESAKQHVEDLAAQMSGGITHSFARLC